MDVCVYLFDTFVFLSLDLHPYVSLFVSFFSLSFSLPPSLSLSPGCTVDLTFTQKRFLLRAFDGRPERLAQSLSLSASPDTLNFMRAPGAKSTWRR